MANMTLKRWTEGFGLKQLGDGVAATLFEGIWDDFLADRGVGNTNKLHHQVANLNDTTIN